MIFDIVINSVFRLTGYRGGKMMLPLLTFAQYGNRATLERTVRGSNPGSGQTIHSICVLLIRMSI